MGKRPPHHQNLGSPSLVVFFFIALISIGLFAQAVYAEAAQTWELGVKAKDWAKFKVRVILETDDPDIASATNRLLILGASQIKRFTDPLESIIFEVENSTKTAALVKQINRLKDGSERIGWLLVDLEEGASDSFGAAGPYISSLLVASGLGVGDVVSGKGGYVVEETLHREYAGAWRPVNHASSRISGPGGEIMEELYWDKETGLLVEYFIRVVGLTRPPELFKLVFSFSRVLVETNLWSPTPAIGFGGLDFRPLTLAAITFLAAAAAASLLKYRFKRKQKGKEIGMEGV